MAKVYLILGSNLGERLEYIDKAVGMLEKRCATLIKRSSVYETEPWGFADDKFFLNQAILIETALNPFELLAEVKKIESLLGRSKGKERYSARCIDIDILFYDLLVLNSPYLVIPHTELPRRRFVLEPLAEISPLLEHPVLRLTCLQMLARCEDFCTVRRIEP